MSKNGIAKMKPEFTGQMTQMVVPPEAIEWDDPSDVPAHIANQVVASDVFGQIHLTFYEMVPPAVFTPERQRAVRGVSAKGKSRVIITPLLARQMIELLGKIVGEEP